MALDDFMEFDEENFDPGHITETNLTREMERDFIDYSMSVIVSRALPDVRDGLKPVQRRILYSMSEMNNGPDKPYRKCARLVGDTMGKYHPHGDSSIYGALVYMAQPWNMRKTLVDGHGNFGSMDGDGAAAMRYTEARMAKIAVEMLRDIDKETVNMVPNYDGEEVEPSVLPARFPNLVVNGSTGIAVGMATNIAPHNLGETIDAVIALIDNPDLTVTEMMEYLKGPGDSPRSQDLPADIFSAAPASERLLKPAAERLSCVPRPELRICPTANPELLSMRFPTWSTRQALWKESRRWQETNRLKASRIFVMNPI